MLRSLENIKRSNSLGLVLRTRASYNGLLLSGIFSIHFIASSALSDVCNINMWLGEIPFISSAAGSTSCRVDHTWSSSVHKHDIASEKKGIYFVRLKRQGHRPWHSVSCIYNFSSREKGLKMLTVDHLHFREDSRLGIPIWLEFNLFLIIITPRHHRILNSMHESIEFPFFFFK